MNRDTYKNPSKMHKRKITREELDRDCGEGSTSMRKFMLDIWEIIDSSENEGEVDWNTVTCRYREKDDTIIRWVKKFMDVEIEIDILKEDVKKVAKNRINEIAKMHSKQLEYSIISTKKNMFGENIIVAKEHISKDYTKNSNMI